MTSNLHSPAPQNPGEFLFYQSSDGRTRLEVRLHGESVWLSLNQLAELFQRDKSVISRHIANLFEEKELRQDSVVAEFATTAADGKTYQQKSRPDRPPANKPKPKKKRKPPQTDDGP